MSRESYRSKKHSHRWELINGEATLKKRLFIIKIVFSAFSSIQIAEPYGWFYLVGLGDLTDDLPGGRVDGGEGFPTGGVVPFIIDEELKTKRFTLVITQTDKKKVSGQTADAPWCSRQMDLFKIFIFWKCHLFRSWPQNSDKDEKVMTWRKASKEPSASRMLTTVVICSYSDIYIDNLATNWVCVLTLDLL